MPYQTCFCFRINHLGTRENLFTVNLPAIIRRVGHVISGIPRLLVTLGQQRLIPTRNLLRQRFLLLCMGVMIVYRPSYKISDSMYGTPDIMWGIYKILANFYRDFRICYLLSMQFGSLFILWKMFKNSFYSLYCSPLYSLSHCMFIYQILWLRSTQSALDKRCVIEFALIPFSNYAGYTRPSKVMNIKLRFRHYGIDSFTCSLSILSMA